MKISILKAIVEFESYPKYYTVEESGEKPNTIRALTVADFEKVKTATHIRIKNTHHTNDSFERKITNIMPIRDIESLVLKSADKFLVQFSWEHPPAKTVKNSKPMEVMTTGPDRY